MNNRVAFFASSIVILLAAAPAALADPFDGMDMRAIRGTGPGSVDITWTGGQPTFRVYRSTNRQTVLDPGNQIGTTDIRSFSDTPPAGSILYYEIKSPCVYGPPEICNGLDDDCNGSIDGPGSEVNCQLSHAVPVCAAGACAIASCTSSFGDCDNSPANGCESNLGTDAAHCGSCSLDCGAGQGPCVHVACANFACLPPVDTSRCLAPDGVPGAGACAAQQAGCSATTPDSDSDGLNDTWEDAKAIDLNCDGVYDSNDVVIPDANKAVSDVYVRVSWMEASTHLYPIPDPSTPGCPIVSFSEPPDGHKPLQDSIDFAVRAFAGAHLTPAAQPCGKPGDLPCGPVSTCVDFACLPSCTTDSQCAASCNADCQGTGGAHCVPAASGPNKVCRKWRLHVDPLPAAGVPHHDITTYGTISPTCANTAGGGSMTPNDQVNLFDYKTPSNFDPKELPFKRFMLFAHDNTCYGGGSPGCGDVTCQPVDNEAPKPKTTGMSEIQGNDAIVSLGTDEFLLAAPERISSEAGTFLHELGHNLGLGHGGPGASTGEPQKVNYLSVMNYRYQLTGIPVTNTVGSNVPVGSRPDFAHKQFGQPLNEGNLSEPIGVGPPPPPEPNTKALIRYSHPPTPPCPCPIDPCTGAPRPRCDAYAAISGPVGPPPIDWNCDGTISPLGVAADINGNGIQGEIQDPAGTEDWMNLFYGYQCQASYADGPTGPVKQGAPTPPASPR